MNKSGDAQTVLWLLILYGMAADQNCSGLADLVRAAFQDLAQN